MFFVAVGDDGSLHYTSPQHGTATRSGAAHLAAKVHEPTVELQPESLFAKLVAFEPVGTATDAILAFAAVAGGAAAAGSGGKAKAATPNAGCTTSKASARRWTDRIRRPIRHR